MPKNSSPHIKKFNAKAVDRNIGRIFSVSFAINSLKNQYASTIQASKNSNINNMDSKAERGGKICKFMKKAPKVKKLNARKAEMINAFILDSSPVLESM